MKLLYLYLIITLLSFCSFANESSPNHITEDNWIPISEGLGFVITGTKKVVTDKMIISGNEIPVIADTLEGYFMKFDGKQWIKISHNTLKLKKSVKSTLSD